MKENQLMDRVRSVRYTCFWLIGTMLLILADQVTKKLAVVYLKQQGNISLISGILELQYLESSYLLFYKDSQDPLLQTADHYQWISCIRCNRQFYRQSCSWLCS